ncbi:MAG TPA: OmpA family protein [Stellaceae bacterium]|jgi:opacity protein-like surface antigen
MTNRCLLGAGVALAVALGGVQAHAQMLGNLFGPYPPGAFYLGPEGGWTQLQSHEDHFRVTSGTRTVGFNPKETFNSGFNVGARGGYMWGPWRFEEEYTYSFNGVQSFGGAGPAIVKGDRHSNAIMTNVIYDLTLGWPITPHIGAGIGAINIDDGVSNQAGRNPVQLQRLGIHSFSLSGNTWEFGYQGIAGIRYMINPALAIDVDYRYLATPDFTLKSKNIGPRGALGSLSYKTGYSTQNVVASLTMMFGAPPPPAAPPPAPPAPPPPPPHQVYLVFFDWDRYNITPEGMQILAAAADHWKAGGAVQIQVTGYTDLSGSAGYNQRLSERRANAVAVALERLGVPRNEMIVSGRGMNDPRVPTPLGVREPQNRRVEIVFP